MSDNPLRTICDVRRLLGRTWADPDGQDALPGLPYKVHEHDGRPLITVEVRGEHVAMTPEHVAGILLGNLRDTAARVLLDEDIQYAVLAVPASFTDQQRQAIQAAGALAGLHVLRVVDESVAAGIAFGVDRRDGEGRALVLEIGARQSAVTVFEVDQGVFESLVTVSLPIGGDLLNQRAAQV